MHVVLISTYELGHQPFGLASPAMWLKQAGAEVTSVDLAVESFSGAAGAVAQADLVAFYLPMHTATKLAVAAIRRVKRSNPAAHLCAYGLYAPVNEGYLRRLGVESILGGEYEQGLVDLYTSLARQEPVALPPISLARQQFQVPDRSDLPGLENYVCLHLGDDDTRVTGYTEASRGCKHLCRHCPIVPVYNGRFRIVQREVVLADIRQQVAAGAQHITFGDPDFFNGPGHALALVEALHQEFPELTYDVTIKVEHILKYAQHLPVLKETGCLFVISAVEATDDRVLEKFQKGHTRAEFEAAVALFRQVGLMMIPTFVTFTPWTTPLMFAEMLATIERLGLVAHVAPIQYAIRLLIPAESKLLELEEVRELVGPFDEESLFYPWQHGDERMDELYEMVFRLVKANQKSDEPRWMLFERIWEATAALVASGGVAAAEALPERSRQPGETVVVPTLSEDWY